MFCKIFQLNIHTYIMGKILWVAGLYFTPNVQAHLTVVV